MGLCESTQHVVENNNTPIFENTKYNPDEYEHLDKNNNRRKSNFHLKDSKHDWKNTNLALFGSDLEKQVKKESALTEPAWYNAGQNVGVKVWRVNNFKIEHWPIEQYGEFYNGDSYIILNTYEKDDEGVLFYDVHFWIGKFSSQDEYGTAAYKTVELDCYLDFKPTQHREVQGHESELFLSYFKRIYILNGGCDSGFRRVLPENYEPRLIRVRKNKCGRITCTEMEFLRENINEEDVFILDYGAYIYQYQGENSCSFEKYQAGRVCARLKNDRFGNCDVEIIDNDNLESLGIECAGEFEDDTDSGCELDCSHRMAVLKLSDSSGHLQMTSFDGFGDGFNYNCLDSGDVFILVFQSKVFVWIGKDASTDERRNCISYASNYLSDTSRPWLPITVVAEGKENSDFWKEFEMN